MSNWKKYIFVAVICMLVLGLMLYGDLGNTGGGGQEQRNFGTASVIDRVNGPVIEMGTAQVANIVNLFNVTRMPPVINPQLAHDEGNPLPQEMVSSYLYYRQAWVHDKYAVAPKDLEDRMNLYVWQNRKRLVDANDPERSKLRDKNAADQGTTVSEMEEFMRCCLAGAAKQNQFLRSMGNNRSDLALMYMIERERPRIRYQEFPAADYLAAARTAVAGDAVKLKARYELDKVKPRTKTGETGDSMTRPVQLQFDIFWIEQDAFFAQEEAKIGAAAQIEEYNRQRDDFEKKGVDSVLTKKKAWITFKDYKPRAAGVAPLKIDPAWKDLPDDAFLTTEGAVLDYIKYEQLIPRKLIGRSSAVIRDFASRYNEKLRSVAPEERGDYAPKFLNELKTKDADAYEKQFQFVHYLRSDLASHKSYASAPQVQLSTAIKAPNPLQTFFDQVINQGRQVEFQGKLSDPVPYQITQEGGKDLLTPKAGGSLVFQLHTVKDLDAAAALMKLEEPEAQALLIERLAREEAAKLAEAAAKTVLESWKADPAKLPTDPKVLQEYTKRSDAASQQAPNPLPEEQRKESILYRLLYPPHDSATPDAEPEVAVPGQLMGPFSAPTKAAALPDAEEAKDVHLRDCYVIGFIAEYHQVSDPQKRLADDAGWRSGYGPRQLSMLLYGFPGYGQYAPQPGLLVTMLHQSVPDSFATTIHVEKEADEESTQ